LAFRDLVQRKPRRPEVQAKYDHTLGRAPGARGIESVRVILAELPPYWYRRARVSELLDRAIAGIAKWKDGDQPVASLQRAAALVILSLELALNGQSPPAALPSLTPEEVEDDHRWRPKPKPRRRYSQEELGAS
jgi:hypothetical protein